MKIYDCFMFFDEEMLLDLRLNIMDKYVDKFIITEASYMHSGESKKLAFDISKFSKFKDKIIYNVVNEIPPNIEIIEKNDSNDIAGSKLINNSLKRENFQREWANQSLKYAEAEDIIIINDIDEIPNLQNLNLKKIGNKIIMFKQKTFYYKFNLLYKNVVWHGSRACKKKNFLSPQWLRNIKHRKYPIWRLDTFFSKKKYNNIAYVENGGWHFTNIKSPEDLEKKFSNFLHHQDYAASGLNLTDINEMVKNKKVLYDLSIDRRDFKWSGKNTLEKVNFLEMPDYLQKNKLKFLQWLEP